MEFKSADWPDNRQRHLHLNSQETSGHRTPLQLNYSVRHRLNQWPILALLTAMSLSANETTFTDSGGQSPFMMYWGATEIYFIMKISLYS